MRPRVHTEKHIVQRSLFTVAAGALDETVIAVGVAAPVAAQPSHVREGCVISAVYIEMWITGDDATPSSSIITLERRPSGLNVMTVAESALLNDYANKKNVLHTFMGLIPPDVQFPTATIKGWFKIPKGKQRFGLEDRLVLNIHGQSNGLDGCGFFLYKEQY